MILPAEGEVGKKRGTLILLAVTVAILLVLGGLILYVPLSRPVPQPLIGDFPSTGAKTTITSPYGPGPFSSFPASWDNPCGLPVQGNLTTTDAIGSSRDPAAANVNLTQVYSKIVSSSAFQALSAGKTWVTLGWTIEEATGPAGSQTEVHADFILLSGGQPVSYPQVGYLPETGQVIVEYNGPLVSSCPQG